MPDKDGKLTLEDRQKINSYLQKYPVARFSACPICGSTEWMIAEYMVQPVTIGPGGGVMLGGIGYPQIMLISNPCGYTRFMNAVLIGIVVQQTVPETPPKAASSG